ncbi:MAG: hypothetical protein ACLP4R_07205 [Solirubrobacteraceae bacterium]
MAADDQKQTQLGAEDRKLIDLVTAALVDPNIHTDARMRLYEDITEIVRNAHQDLSRPALATGERQPVKTYKQPLPTNTDGVRDLLAQVLVDPNLHTDTRLRLYNEISNLLRDAKVLA